MPNTFPLSFDAPTSAPTPIVLSIFIRPRERVFLYSDVAVCERTMNTPFAPNTLYYGDCLDINVRFLPDNYIDLICLDPPLQLQPTTTTTSSKAADSRQMLRSKHSTITWEWNAQSAERVDRLKNAVANPASKVIAGFEGFIPQSKMLSYTSYNGGTAVYHAPHLEGDREHLSAL